MLTLIKSFIKTISLPILYIGSIFVAFKTVSKETRIGFYLLVFLIPQTNLWHKLFAYPLGSSLLDILILSILLGIIYQGKGFIKTNNTKLIFILIIVSYFSLWNSSLRFSLPPPISTSNYLLEAWKDYARMVFLYFLALNFTKDKKEQEQLIFVITLVLLLITIRSFRNFSAGITFNYDNRDPGPFASYGLNANNYGSFLVDFGVLVFSLSMFTKERIKKYTYLLVTFLSISAMLFTYSRGAYVGALAALVFVSLRKRSLLIVVCILILSWQFVLPTSVVNRIAMTEESPGKLEGSAAHRVVLWEHANELFKEHPVFGVGFRGFAMSMPEGELKDTHNYFMLMLCEQGIIGFVIFLLTLLKSGYSGWRLYKISNCDFYKGLGFGLMACVVACSVTNMFGDRWSYFPTGGYFWILWGVVDRSILLVESSKSISEVS
jgi:putative inorganic carbon (hco3(-)) transporter